MSDQNEELVQDENAFVETQVEDEGKLNPETIGKPRDETGRFVPQQALHASRQKEREASEQARAATEASRADRERAERLERELYELRGQFTAFQSQPRAPQEAPKPPPEWFDDPDAALEARLEARIKPLREQLQSAGQRPNDVLETISEMMAVEKYGAETVQTARAELDKAMRADPAFNAAVHARLRNSKHPYGELVKIHKERAALSRFGDDPEAAFEAEVQRRLAAARQTDGAPSEQEQPITPAAPKPPVMPGNFANSRSAGARNAPQWSGPKPLSELYGGR